VKAVPHTRPLALADLLHYRNLEHSITGAQASAVSMPGPPLPDYSLPAVLRAQGPPEGLWLDSVYVPRAPVRPVWPQEGRDLMFGRRMTLIGDSQVTSSPLSVREISTKVGVDKRLEKHGLEGGLPRQKHIHGS